MPPETAWGWNPQLLYLRRDAAFTDCGGTGAATLGLCGLEGTDAVDFLAVLAIGEIVMELDFRILLGVHRMPRLSDRLLDRQRLPYPANDAAHLDQCHHDEHQPKPHDPVHLRARTRHFVQAVERCPARCDGETPELDLDKDLDHATDDDQPEQHETRLRPHRSGRNQLAGTNDRAGDDQARPELPENPTDGGCWI